MDFVQLIFGAALLGVGMLVLWIVISMVRPLLSRRAKKRR